MTLGGEDASGATVLTLNRRGRATRIAANGDVSPLGGTLNLTTDEGAIALAGGRLALLVDLAGAPVRAAVLETRVHRPPAR